MTTTLENIMPITLTDEQQSTLLLIEDEALRAKLEKMLINAQLEAQASAKTVRGRPAKLDPVRYVSGILEHDKDLDTQLEIIVQSAVLIYPDVVTKAQEHFGEKFKEFQAIDFLRIIFTVVQKDNGWGNRDIGGRLTALYETLTATEDNESQVEEEKTSSLDDLPVATNNNDDNKTEEAIVEPKSKNKKP